MCIRDRVWVNLISNALKYSAPKEEILIEIGSMTGPDDVTSVSYTHLRAHETVLDLVCRLLLEKNH